LLAACVTPPSTSSLAASERPSEPAATVASSAPASTVVPSVTPTDASPSTVVMTTYPVTAGSRPHDVAPATDGGVWYTGQANGTLGWLDPETGEVREVMLGAGSAPHGVIVGPDGAPWITDGGLNAIVRVDPESSEVSVFPLIFEGTNANLNTATFDGDGILWFTGQGGWYGRLDPVTGRVETFPAPLGAGPYGIATMPDGEVAFSSLAGSYLGLVDRGSGDVQVLETPTAGGGARRVWSDSAGRLWITEWFAGNLAMYDRATGEWREWPLPGDAPQPYAVFVDDTDAVWVTDFGANAMHRFDPATEAWTTFVHESAPAEVRQLLGRPGEVWGAESAADQLVVVRRSDG
jgi:virginiamycin B lyase